MAALTPVASVDALVSAIQKSGLLTADKLKKLREAAAQVTDPKQLARDLVKDGTLTKWQAGQLMHGYHLLVLGKYKLMEELGAAPTGRVYLVEHAQIARRHTLKVLAKRLASNPQAVKHFLASAQNACGLDHRNISHVYDVNQEGDRHYVVMEYVEGQDLDKLVTRGGRVGVLPALDFIVQAAEGLAHAHENGVVHGDLKPSNLLRDPGGTIKILEIGQTGTGATFEAEGAEESIEMAALGAVIFQAPELRGDGDVPDVACDVYSLGSILTFLLTGKAAADAAAATEQLKAVGDVQEEVVGLCGRLMADKPADRPRSMAAVLDDLATVARQLAAPKKKADSAVVSTEAEKTDAKELAAVKLAEPPAKAKKPPMAKALDDNGTPPIVISDEALPVIDLEPIGPFVIKTRGRAGKHLTAKVEKPTPEQAQPEPKGKTQDEKPQKVAPAKTSMPLIIAAAIGGGGVLLLALIIALVCVLAFGGKRDVAQGAKTKAAPAAKAAAPTPAPVERNPPSNEGEKNPEVNPAAVAPDASAAAATTTDAKSTSAKESPPEKTPASSADAPATDAKKESPPEPKTEPKPQPPPETKPAAKPTASKATPKSEPKAEPFKGLAKAVSLPDLPELPSQPATSAIDPLILGPCKLADKTTLAVTLVGGDGAIRTSRQRFEIQPRANSTSEWDFLLSGGAAPVVIAGLSAKDANLIFQWTDEGIKQASVAGQLANCALNLTAEKANHLVALRTPVMGQPLTVEIDKAGAGVRWNIGEMPVAKQIFVEVTRVDGFQALKKEPTSLTVPVGETITVWTGTTEKMMPLALKLTTSSTARGMEVKLMPHAKLEGQELRAYRRKEFSALQLQMENEMPLLVQQLEQAKRDRPSTNPVKGPIEKKQIDDRKAALAAELTRRTAVREQLEYLLGFTGTFQNTAQIHFRVYYQAGDTKIDLLRTEEEALPAKK
jgi:eukaryotic-like serine/threonine-protein kinase